MFRSKSFNINQPVALNSLPHYNSVPNMKFISVNVRSSIIIKEVDKNEALNTTNMLINETMNKEWRYENSVGFLNDDDEEKKWNDRYNSANYIFKQISISAKSDIDKKNRPKDSIFFAAYFKGVPIGVLQFSPQNKDYPELPIVDYLATHCGIRDCGVLLIECAVNKSQQLGMKGKLILSSVKAAKQLYISMGFTQLDDEVYLQLNPNESSKWYFINNCYKFIG
ncbi:N-acetyltransferase [Xenorhabdus hominickii]|nr:N-acetyltransferase [Xenorhabdus hominickii]PHM57143.1 N-acetyltransferase [Xenorhabdus hominickii]